MQREETSRHENRKLSCEGSKKVETRASFDFAVTGGGVAAMVRCIGGLLAR